MSWAEANRSWLEPSKANWLPVNPEPLLVRAWLAAPVAFDGYDLLTLEGALQYAVVIREAKKLPDDVFSGVSVNEVTDIPIPIVDSTAFGEELIAHASVGFFSSDATATSRWRRQRPRAERYGKDVVNAAMAEMKASNMPAATVTAVHVTFYVLGDRARLKALLKGVSHLGSKRAGGLGRVLGWEVEATQTDWSIIGPEGRLMRSIPAKPGLDAPNQSWVREATLRAPYWHPRTRTQCHVPVTTLGEDL